MSEKSANTTLNPLTLLLGGFPALTSLWAKKTDSDLMEMPVDYGQNNSEFFASYDPDTHSLKTLQGLLFSDSTESCQTLPPSGSMLNGKCYLEPVLVHQMSVRGYSSLPTPGHRDYRDVSMKEAYAASRDGHQPSLATEILLAGVGGQRIGQIYEWVMGFPYDFLGSSLECTETPLSPQSLNGSENE